MSTQRARSSGTVLSATASSSASMSASSSARKRKRTASAVADPLPKDAPVAATPDSDNSEGDNADGSSLTPMDVDDDDNDHKSASRERGASGSAAPPAKRQAKKQEESAPVLPADEAVDVAESIAKSDAQQYKLSKRLAHNELKIRMKALKAVRAWLHRRQDISGLDMLKLWKGLFYCMWFSDKPLVQQELAENLARLVEHLQPARAVLFVNAFMQTMIREWTGIDRLRLDKFMSLVRKAVHHMLQYLHKRQWDQQLLEQFVNILRSRTAATELSKGLLPSTAPGPGPICINAPTSRGVCLHVCDLFFKELNNVVVEHQLKPGDIPTPALHLLLEPFLDLMTIGQDMSMAKRAESGLFAPLLEACESDDDAASDADNDAAATETYSSRPFWQSYLASITLTLFQRASARATHEKQRPTMYRLFNQYKILTLALMLATDAELTVLPVTDDATAKMQVKKSKKRKASKSPPSRGSKGSKEVQSKTNGGGKKPKLDSAAAAATGDAAPKVASPKVPVTSASGVKRARSADSVSPPHATVDTAVTTAKSKKPKPSASPPTQAPAAVPVAVTKPAKAKPKANAAAAAAADSASLSPVNNAAAHMSGRATPKKAAQSGSSEVSSPRGKAVVSSPKQLPAASPTGDRHVRFSKENHVQPFLKTTPARTVSKSAPRGSPQDNLEYIRQQLSKKSPKGLLKSQPASPSSKARPAAEVKPVQSASAVALAQLTDQQAGKSKQKGSTPGKKGQAAASAAPVKATGTPKSSGKTPKGSKGSSLSVSTEAADASSKHPHTHSPRNQQEFTTPRSVAADFF